MESNRHIDIAMVHLRTVPSGHHGPPGAARQRWVGSVRVLQVCSGSARGSLKSKSDSCILGKASNDLFLGDVKNLCLLNSSRVTARTVSQLVAVFPAQGRQVGLFGRLRMSIPPKKNPETRQLVAVITPLPLKLSLYPVVEIAAAILANCRRYSCK